jgi:hypothetical protein
MIRAALGMKVLLSSSVFTVLCGLCSQSRGSELSQNFEVGKVCYCGDFSFKLRMKDTKKTFMKRCIAQKARHIVMGIEGEEKRLFIFGAGYTGLALAVAARHRWNKDICTISGTCHTTQKADSLRYRILLLVKTNIFPIISNPLSDLLHT